MGKGDFPILARQWIHAFTENYRSSSLYRRNLGFFFLGIIGGSIYGTRQRKANEAKNADFASVHLTFYELPRGAATAAAQPQTNDAEKAPLTQKRLFEKLWGEAAKLLQRQPGYTYTVMFRRVVSAEGANEWLLTQQQKESGQRLADYSKGQRKRVGVSAGLEDAAAASGGAIKEGKPAAVDYVEMRVWENQHMQQKAQAKQFPWLQKMQKVGVNIHGGVYRRVFDDALVRIIQ